MTSSIENNKLCVEEMIMEIKNDIVGIRQGNVDLERRVLGVETGQAFYESKVNEETDMIKRLNAELFTTQVQFE